MVCSALKGEAARKGGTELAPPFEHKCFDYGNQLGVSLGGIFGLKKTRYAASNIDTGVIDTSTGVDFATITLSSYSPTVA